MGNTTPKSKDKKSNVTSPRTRAPEADDDDETPFELNKLNLLRGIYLNKITTALDAKRPDEAREAMQSFISESCRSLITLPANVSAQLRTFKWFNTGGESLTFLDKLKGKVVLLDFWTYCCINCLHVLPDLEYLEEKYKDGPVFVVGVHSAKFDNEKDDDNIRDAVIRTGIHHAVCNDSEMLFWRLLSLRSWPSFVLVGPRGEIVFSIQGEGRREILDLAIQCTLEYYEKEADLAKLVNREPIPLALEKPTTNASQDNLLSYPGKIAVHEDILFISDTNNHRILIAKFEVDREGTKIMSLNATVLCSIGRRGHRGFRDGSLKKARFNRPQGVAFDPESKILYVADTENHAIRQVHLPHFPAIDPEQLQVVTILGTGSQVQNYKAEVDHSRKYGISSPWDLILCRKPKKRRLLVAMAGTHQIWDFYIHKLRATVLAGTGQERRQDSSETENAAFAQPSGLCIHPHGDSVLIADSESSSIRVVKLDDGNTTTFVGGGTDPDDLFQYGDIDEQGSVARLQHPLAMTFLDGAETVIIADTYNHKLKRADWSSATVKTWDIRYHDGDVTDGAAVIKMSEPSGLALSSQRNLLFVADTNNSLIRGVDVESGVLHTVKFTEAESETTKKQKKETKTGSTKATAASKPLVNKLRAIKLERRQLETGPDCKISIELLSPKGNHFTEGAPTRCQLEAGEHHSPVVKLTPQDPQDDCHMMKGSISFDATASIELKEVELQVIAYICSDEDGLCSQMEVVVPIHAIPSSNSEEVTLTINL